MSVVAYNGITLPYANTVSFSQDAVRDDSSTDRILTKFDIQVQCLLSADYMALLAPDLMVGGDNVTQNPADIMTVIRSRLLQDRRRLSFTFNGVELIPQPQDGVTRYIDAMNGPQPQTCSILSLTNSLFLLNYHIIAHYWESNEVDPDGPAFGTDLVTNAPGNNVICNRWSETLEFDNCNFCTRNRDGKFKIRSDNVQGKVPRDIMSQMAVVGVPPNFLRKNSSYTISPDGLSLAYRVSDVQQYKMPPFSNDQTPYEARGTYTESMGRMGINRRAFCTVFLKGGPNTSQAVMINLASAICYGKCKLALQGLIPPDGAKVVNGAPVLGEPIPESASVKVGMWENTVEVSLQYLLPACKKKISNIAFLEATAAFVPFVDGAANPPPVYPVLDIMPDPGSQILPTLLQAAAYYDPSIVGAKITPTTGNFAIPNAVMPGQGGVR